MNRIYSTVWSEARGTYVVAHEKSKAKGKPSTTRKGVVEAVAAALLALGAGQAMAMAQSCPGAVNGVITVGSTVTATCALTNGTSLTVSDSGNITAATGILVNSGIKASNITNNGNITSGLIGIRVGSSGASSSAIINSITNTGTISGLYYGFLIADYGNIAGSIVNSGNISAAATSGGIGDGLRLMRLGTIGGNIVNSNASSIIYGINAGIEISRAFTVSGSIINHGIISGGNYGISIYESYGDLQNGISLVSGGITNSGIITGRMEGIFLSHGSLGSGGINNLAGGQIIGTNGIAMDLNTVVPGSPAINITNAGTISGAVNGYANLTNNGLFILPEVPWTVNNSSVTGTYGVSSIYGNYTQGPSGTLRIGASGTATGQYSKLTVGGTATLPALAHIDVNVRGSNLFGTGGGTLTSVISAGTLSASTFNVTDNSVLVDFVGVKNGNAVDLKVVEQAAATPNTAVLASVQSVSNAPATGAATVLDRLLGLSITNGSTGNAGMDAVMNNLTTNHSGTRQQVSDAVSQTLPLLTGGQAAAISGAQHSVNRIVQARQEGQQGRSSGDEFLGNKQVWVKPFGSEAVQDNMNGVTGFKAKSSGIVFGVDSEVQNVNRLGGALAIAHTNVDGNSAIAPQSSTVDSYQFVLYGSRSLSEATDINFQADIGNHTNKGLRNVTFMGSTAKSDYNSLSAHLGAGLAHTMTLSEKTSFTPSVRADYTRVNDDAYTETGAGALNLAVGSNTTEEFILSADAKLTHKLQERTLLTANLGAGFDTMNQQASITASYAGAPSASFTTNGLKPSPWLVRGGLGVVHTTVKGLELTARYDVEGRESFINQTVSAKLRWAF